MYIKHIIVKFLKSNGDKNILKAAKGKRSITFNRAIIRIIDDFSAITMEAKKQWNNVLLALK